MSKTPYELRYELLMMAQSILNEQTMNVRIQIENNWNMQCEAARVSAESTHTTPIFPAFPSVPFVTEEDIIKTANKLNEFVSKTGE
jgi:hypothetical protein